MSRSEKLGRAHISEAPIESTKPRPTIKKNDIEELRLIISIEDLKL